MASVAKRRTAVSDILTGGSATISGTVKVLTVPTIQTVVLFDQENMRPRRSTRSDASGAFSFAGVATGKQWFVVSINAEGAYNAVISDRITT